jgi:hypothetical protein
MRLMVFVARLEYKHLDYELSTIVRHLQHGSIAGSELLEVHLFPSIISVESLCG